MARWGGGRIRVGPWHGDDRVAYLAPVGDGPAPGPSDVRHTLERLTRSGYAEAVTAAIGPLEAHGFVLAGFEVHERLHLLARDLRDLPESPAAALRRARRRDRPRVLAIDGAAFSPFWRLDDAGLEEALSATPSSRFRVALDPDADAAPSNGDNDADAGPDGETGETGETGDAIVGYAICGRAGRRGFVQRLAVDPTHHGHGLGQALLLDGLGWLRRRGVDRVVVNTQEANGPALALYERLGFRRQPGGLAVLKKSLVNS